MNKNQVLAILVFSTLALGQAGFVSADEVTPIDSSAPTTEVGTPTAPSASTETKAPSNQSTEPSVTPVDPTAPSDKPQDNSGSLDGVSTDKPAPSDKTQDKGNAGSLDGVPTPSDKPQDKDNAGSLDGVPADKPAPSDKAQDKDNAGSLDGVPDEQPKTTDQANQQGKSQIGTTSRSTGQVVHDVTKAPVETNTGASIISTNGGNLVLSDGSVVAPEELGAVTNEDKTISVSTADGKMVTLPNTGTKQSFLAAIGGLLLTGVSYFYKKQLF